MILAIDTASKTATVAIVENNKICAEFSVMSEKTHSKAILPMIQAMFKCSNRQMAEIEYIACVNGPGSFTGIRIGATVSKSIAFTQNKKIVPVSSLDVLAYNVFVGGYTICSIIDARKKHVYACFYKYADGLLVKLTDYKTISIEEVIQIGNSFSAPLYFVGSGAEIYESDLRKCENAIIAPPQLNIHRAGVLGIYTATYIEKLTMMESRQFKPIYMSRSQAEDSNVQSN